MRDTTKRKIVGRCPGCGETVSIPTKWLSSMKPVPSCDGCLSTIPDEQMLPLDAEPVDGYNALVNTLIAKGHNVSRR